MNYPIKRYKPKYKTAAQLKKKPKYSNKKVIIDGFKFDSKLEAEYYLKLKRAGVKFEMQVPFILQDKFKQGNKTYRAIKYLADFVIYDKKGEIEKVVDVKGMQTQIFKMKAKMFVCKFDMPLVLVERDQRTKLLIEKEF